MTVTCQLAITWTRPTTSHERALSAGAARRHRHATVSARRADRFTRALDFLSASLERRTFLHARLLLVQSDATGLQAVMAPVTGHCLRISCLFRPHRSTTLMRPIVTTYRLNSSMTDFYRTGMSMLMNRCAIPFSRSSSIVDRK